jgi:drug/metabolite transporter (DMT)-like permease
VGSIAMSAQAYLRILVGVGLGVGVLGEELAASTVAGLVLVVAGVVAMTLPGRYHRRNGTQREPR